MESLALCSNWTCHRVTPGSVQASQIVLASFVYGKIATTHSAVASLLRSLGGRGPTSNSVLTFGTDLEVSGVSGLVVADAVDSKGRATCSRLKHLLVDIDKDYTLQANCRLVPTMLVSTML